MQEPRSSVLAHIVWAVALFAVAAGIYLWQHSQISDLNSRLSTSQASLKEAQQAQAAADQYATYSAVGVPASLKTKTVVTTLTLPADQSALNLAPGVTTPVGLAAYFATSSSDVLANWLFQGSGTPDAPAGTTTTGTFFVSDMTQWAAVADAAPASYPGAGAGGKQLSVADKKAFISQLKTDTAACANDTTKGLTTGDKVFNICYTLTRPQAQGGNWSLSLQGYGEPASLPVYLGGSVSVGPDASYKAATQKYIGAFKQLRTAVVASNPS